MARVPRGGEPVIGADDIRWTPAPIPPPGLTTMADEDMLIAAICEADSYRALAQQAIRGLHDLQCAHDQLRAGHHRLIDESRRLRVSHLVEAR